MRSVDEKFYDEIEELKYHYKKSPKLVTRKLERFLIGLRVSRKDIFKNMDWQTLSMAIVIIIILLIGLINIDVCLIYYGGLAFFFAGFFIGLYVKGFGLLFLLSHGCTGLFVATISIIESIFSNPLLSDNPINIYIYLGICLLILLFAIILTIFHNLSEEFRNISFI